MRNYRDLIVWQKSMALVTEVYSITRLFPKEELYGLISQVRRSAVSIPSNIAEGYDRDSTNDYTRFFTDSSWLFKSNYCIKNSSFSRVFHVPLNP